MCVYCTECISSMCIHWYDFYYQYNMIQLLCECFKIKLCWFFFFFLYFLIPSPDTDKEVITADLKVVLFNQFIKHSL